MRKAVLTALLCATPVVASAQPQPTASLKGPTRKPVALLGPHLVCGEAKRAEFLAEKQEHFDTFGEYYIANNQCAVLPAGTRVTVQRVRGDLSCLRPVGARTCGWTALVPRQAYEFQRFGY